MRCLTEKLLLCPSICVAHGRRQNTTITTLVRPILTTLRFDPDLCSRQRNARRCQSRLQLPDARRLLRVHTAGIDLQRKRLTTLKMLLMQCASEGYRTR